MGTTPNGSIRNYFGKSSWLIPELGFVPDASDASKEPVTSGTTDTIEQVHSKRPICQTKDKDAVDGNGSSSSNMISFELSNGDPFCPHVPRIMEDDQYVEYQLDDSTVFPCNVEEEEKMFMEAIIKSLKDLEMQRSCAEEQPKAGAGSTESLQKDETNSVDTSSTTEKHSSLSPESISTPVEHHQAPFETDSVEQVYCDTSVSTVEPAFEVPPLIPEPRSSGTSAQSNISTCTQGSSDANISASTKATVTVVRSSSSNIMDGLVRCWDLSFFRSSR